MRMQRWVMLVAALGVVLLASNANAQNDDDDQAADRVRRVGVVFDGPAPRMNDVWQAARREMETLIGSEFQLEFPKDRHLEGDWTAKTASRLLDQLLHEPDMDLVIAFGVLASHEAARRRSLPKPTIAAFVLDARLQGLAGKNGKPQRRRNLSYLVWSINLKRDLKVFRELGDLDKIAYLINAHFHHGIPGLSDATVKLAKKAGVDLVMVPMKTDVAAAVQSIGADVQAVYVGPNMQLSLDEIGALAKRLNERKLPSFSWLGRAELERGLLMGLGDSSDIDRLARRLALNTQSIFLGDEPSSMVTAFKMEERLVINMATARAIGMSPSWSLLTEAEQLNKQRATIARKLSLAKVVEEAQRSNIDLRALKTSVLAGEEDITTARAKLLPRLEASLTGTWIDSDRTGMGNTERTLQWSAGLTQVIFAERAWAGLSIANHVQTARVHDEHAARLDIVRAAAISYLNVLRAKTAERIQRDNLRLTREHLSLARVRERIGTGRPAEVLRWESSIASGRRQLIQLVAQRNLAEMELNRILSRPIEEPFLTAEPSLDDSPLLSAEPRFRKLLSNPKRFRLARKFMVAEGLRAAPEIKSLSSLMAAKEREADSNRLAPFVPSFALQTGVTHRFLQGGAGTQATPTIPGISFPDPNNFDWQVGATMTLPLYAGGERYARTRKSEKEHAALSLQKDSLRERVDQQIRSALHQTGASLPGIGLAREAARAANASLKLVTGAYSTGAASILDVLDAQNQALVAELGATTAVYAFLIDLMNVERAIGHCDFTRSKADRVAFMERLEAYVRREE